MKQKNLETWGFSLREELEKLRALPREKRWEYIWDYYKAAILGLLAAVLLLWLLGSFVAGMIRGTFFPKAPVSVAFAVPGYTGCDSWLDSCAKAIGYDPETENLQILSTIPYTTTRDDFVIQTSLWFTAGQPDIFLVDEAGYRHLKQLEVLADLGETWPPELLALASDRMVSTDAVDVTHTPMAKACGIDAQPVYLCMFVSGKGFQRGLDIVAYILTEA